ncbi:molybdopterin-guanine dinucleotide biosynthesis protein B [Paenibacillus sp. GCM10023248]|uniref:molybdopterin-guanine dinucleotide biosynthesis protein B n=1 Tax=unclassified Paenibacillus TaxID=185978 RepID=UPI002377FCB6|nr:molybdopterin-guanine dinucleotide biosynthesis protein B [Paenibacillus sp. MAHUQ-63]MDD9265669.1 molybdopterin-guanine dinucleotide biosynthesis protein B [Paenibacillus sp. MAHUQ-63]
MAHCIGFAGYSNSGKTTLIAKLVVEMKRRNKRVVVMKHDAHGHYKEASGADSTIFAESGADAVVTLSPGGVHVYERKQQPDLQEQVRAWNHLDYVFVEGFKREKHPKIAIFRTIEQRGIVHVLEPEPIAIATDLEAEGMAGLAYPIFDVNDASALADFIQRYFEGDQY